MLVFEYVKHPVEGNRRACRLEIEFREDEYIWLGIMAVIKTGNAQRKNTFFSIPSESTWRRVQAY